MGKFSGISATFAVADAEPKRSSLMISSTGPLTFRTHLIQSADHARITHLPPHIRIIFAAQRSKQSNALLDLFSHLSVVWLPDLLPVGLSYIPRTLDSARFPMRGLWRIAAS